MLGDWPGVLRQKGKRLLSLEWRELRLETGSDTAESLFKLYDNFPFPEFIHVLTQSIKKKPGQICPAIPISIFNRPGVAVAVLETPPSLIHRFSDHFPPNLQNPINPKPIKLRIYQFYTMFTTWQVSPKKQIRKKLIKKIGTHPNFA